MNRAKIKRLVVICASVFLLVGAWDLSRAQAEVARTKKPTRMMQRRGNKSRVLARVPAGRKVTVLQRAGAWVKIRYGGRTGWVKRTSIGGGSGKVRRKKRRGFVEGRKKKRNFSGSAPSDRIGADAVKGGNDVTLKNPDAPVDTDVDSDGTAEPQLKRTVTVRDVPKTELSGPPPAEKREDGATSARDASGDDARVVVLRIGEADMRRFPNSRAKPVDTLYQGAQLIVLEENESGSWLFVENTDGEQGWLQASAVGSPDAPAIPKLSARARVRAGYSQYSQAFASDGGAEYELSQYNLSSGAASLSVGGDVLYRAGSSFLIGADAGYTGSLASPGIHFEGQAGVADIAFVVHEFNGGARAGIDLHRGTGLSLSARAGYHYSFFGVQNYANPNINLARMPSEILRGLTLGARFDVPRLSESVGVHFGADVLFPNGVRQQTVNLTDGELASVFALWGMAALTYRWSPDLSFEASYRYTLAKTEWQGPGERPTGAVMESAREDVAHLVSLGFGKAF